jgi:hypothetical protein
VHSVVTVLVVVITGNHWWLDGIVAVGVLATCAWGVYGVRTGWRAALARWRARAVPPPEPALADSPAT